MIEKVNIAEKFAIFPDHFSPKIVGEVNDTQIKLVKFQGDFIWHSHPEEDEMFLVIKGGFEMQFRDQTVEVKSGEFLIVPKGIEHMPVAKDEVWVLLVEPVSTVNTGDQDSSRRVVPTRL